MEKMMKFPLVLTAIALGAGLSGYAAEYGPQNGTQVIQGGGSAPKEQDVLSG
jgi:hypothetical protein